MGKHGLRAGDGVGTRRCALQALLEHRLKAPPAGRVFVGQFEIVQCVRQARLMFAQHACDHPAAQLRAFDDIQHAPARRLAAGRRRRHGGIDGLAEHAQILAQGRHPAAVLPAAAHQGHQPVAQLFFETGQQPVMPAQHLRVGIAVDVALPQRLHQRHRLNPGMRLLRGVPQRERSRKRGNRGVRTHA